jgi:hypothetical protein
VGNIIYRFILGFLAQLGGNEALVLKCSGQFPTWEQAQIKETSSSESTDAQVGGDHSTFTKVLNFLGSAITTICNFKEKIISFLFKRFRRYRRLFLQGKIRSGFRLGWSLSGAWSWIKTKAADVGRAVVATGQWIGKKVDELWEWIKEKINTVLQPIYDFFDQLKAKFVGWLRQNPTMAALLDFASCLHNNGSASALLTVAHVVLRLTLLIPSLATPVGWIALVVHLVCGWEHLRNGINFLLAAVRNTDRLMKYYQYGQMTGEFLRAISGA